jgi:hypothetical protein
LDQPDRVGGLIGPYFARHSPRLDKALDECLAEPILLEPGWRLQFEICPFFYRVVLCVTEAEIMPDGWLMDDLPQGVLDAIEEAGADPLDVISEAVPEWLADGWQRVGGSRLYRPAFAFYHGYSEQFDLERRRWLSVEEAFPD